MSNNKFRIYDKQLKKMCYFTLSNANNYASLGYPIDQYLGQSDRNGIDMYENDIASAYSKNGHECVLGKIVFEGYEYTIETTDHMWPSASFVVLEEFEVLGNIYEDSELLEV